MSPGFPRIRKRLDDLGLGRFQSTPTVSTQKDYETCLVVFDYLIENKEIDVLRALNAGEVSWGELVSLYRRQELRGATIMAKLKLGRPLFAAIAETLPAMGRAEATTTAYRYALQAFERQTVVKWPIKPGAAMTVADLMTVPWAKLEHGWPNSPADFNRVVSALRAFLTKYLGSTRHEFRVRFGALVKLAPEDPRVPDITPERFGALLRVLPKHAAEIAMGLLLTGFRGQSEYFRCDESNLMSHKHQIRLLGKGTKGRRGRIVTIDEELWPYIEASIPAPIGYLQFLRHWHRACVAIGAGQYVKTGKMKRVRVKLEAGQVYTRRGHRPVGVVERQAEMIDVPQLRYVGLRPHDLRHALGQWTTDAGRTITEVKNALGHRSVRTTERYTEDVERGRMAATIGVVVKKRVLGR